MKIGPLPTDPADLSLEILNALIEPQLPGTSLTAFELIESHAWGGGEASSAGRIVIRPTYGEASTAGLPGSIVVKVARTDQAMNRDALAALYSNEVNVYTRLDPAAFLTAPRTLGGAYDDGSGTFLLLLEDLRPRGVTFASTTTPTSIGRMRSLLDQLSTLHARYWNHPTLNTTLGWMERHRRGKLHDAFNTPHGAPAMIALEVEKEQFKREMLQRMGTDVDGLFRRFQQVQQHQSRLPQTICHGDTHIGNSYILPDDKGGLLDWQLTSQGFAMHDVSYVMGTGLSVEDRRRHESELLDYYRERMLEKGAKDVPDREALWTEYCCAMVWGVYIGWLITPVVNYGWEITVMAHLRMMTAYEDLETGKRIDMLG